MAWNPSPEVKASRDAAAAIGKAVGAEVDRCVVLFTTVDGRIGYASYGPNKERCGAARRLAEAAYKAACEQETQR